MSGNFEYIYNEMLRQNLDKKYDIHTVLKRILQIDVASSTSLDCHIYLGRQTTSLLMTFTHDLYSAF